MNRIGLGVLAASVVATLLAVSLPMQPASARPFGVNQRQWRQQGRIFGGVRSGQLTGRETRNLERGESRLRANEYRFRHDGTPGLQPGERARLQHEENNMSRRIYRDKHNGFTQPSSN